MQCVYSRTKEGDEEATEQRVLLRSSTSHLSLGPKIVSQFLRSVALNEFFSCCIFKRRNSLQSSRNYKSLESFCNALNKFQSTADFVRDTSLKLLAQASSLSAEHLSNICQVDFSQDEGRAYVSSSTFSSDHGVILRFRVHENNPRQRVYNYCASVVKIVLSTIQTKKHGKGTVLTSPLRSAPLIYASECIQACVGVSGQYGTLKRGFRCAKRHAFQEIMCEMVMEPIETSSERHLRVLAVSKVLSNMTQIRMRTLPTIVWL